MKTPLRRPDPPPDLSPAGWGAPCVAVVGDGDLAFAERLVEGLRGRGLDASALSVELRHAEGYELTPGRVLTHPDALRGALEAAPRPALTVGVGAAFACAVRADRLFWIRGSASTWTLSPPLRRAVEGAALVLPRADPDVAEALATAWPEEAT